MRFARCCSSYVKLLWILIAGLSTSGAGAGVKIGVVDMQRIILSVQEGKTARENLQKEIQAKEGELRKQKEELDKLNGEWKSQMALLSEDARLRKQTEFQEKFLKLRNEEMQFQQSIKQKEVQATQAIAVKVTKLANTIASKKKIDLVVEANSSGLMYARTPIDLTDEIIKIYDKTPVPGQKISKK